ncbi:hypothetical protein Tco_1414355, partial [Tanacetum coccineum]
VMNTGVAEAEVSAVAGTRARQPSPSHLQSREVDDRENE